MSGQKSSSLGQHGSPPFTIAFAKFRGSVHFFELKTPPVTRLKSRWIFLPSVRLL
jgi:hypothetical protein